MTNQHSRSTHGRNESATPWELFGQLNNEYSFTVDACALEWNAKLPRYWSPDQDGLTSEWNAERVWCNPPYNNIDEWLELGQHAALAVYLLPSRTDSRWWRVYKPNVETHYFRGRVQFIPQEGVIYSSNPGGNCLFCFGSGFTPGKEFWRNSKTGVLL